MKSHVVSVEEGGKRNVISRGKEKFQMVLKSAQPMRKGRAWPESDLEKQFSVSVSPEFAKLQNKLLSLLLCTSSALIMKPGSTFSDT
jgi:hypothetical protein